MQAFNQIQPFVGMQKFFGKKSAKKKSDPSFYLSHITPRKYIPKGEKGWQLKHFLGFAPWQSRS